MVRDGQNCVLAAPEPEQVAKALVELVEDPALRAALASEGAEDMAGHTWEATGAAFEALCLDTAFVRVATAVPG